MSVKRFVANKDNTITNAFDSSLTVRGTSSNMGASDIVEIFSLYGQAYGTATKVDILDTAINSGVAGIKAAYTGGAAAAANLTKENFKITVPVNSAGTGSAFTFKFIGLDASLTAANSAAGECEISIENLADNPAIQSEIIKVINGSAVGANTRVPATGSGSTSRGIDGITAIQGSTTTKVTITATQSGEPGAEISVSLVGTAAAASADILGAGIDSIKLVAASLENARILTEFSTSKIAAARTAGSIPAAGSVNFYLRMFNAEHTSTTPSDFSVKINPLSSAWNEGSGLDMETYTDKDASNWLSSSFGSAWTSEGGDYNTSNTYEKSFSFDGGTEDLLVDITNIVEAWVASTPVITNYGLLVRLDPSYEDGSLERSYYTKKFFARGSQYGLKRPIIEARWNASTQVASSLPDPYVQADEYVANITNLKSSYKKYESATLKLHTRKRDWSPNIYNVAVVTSSIDLISDMYYKVTRVPDNLEVISYSTASAPYYSKLSYNAQGSSFDLDMSIFEENYMYQINFLRKDGSKYIELKDKFRFRVDP
jgi:hypothetical protein